MRVTNNFDESILGEMDQIMGSEEHKNIFSPMVKQAQAAGEAAGAAVSPSAGGAGALVAKPPTSTNEQFHANKKNLAGDMPTVSSPEVASLGAVKAKLQEVAGTPGAHGTAAQAILGGHAGPGAGELLKGHFPGQDPAKLDQLFKQLKPAAPPAAPTTASVSNVLPTIVKIADALGEMGYELSELAADNLIQTITIEAKAKVTKEEKAKADKKAKDDEEKAKKGKKEAPKADPKCKKCGGKCDSKGKCAKGDKCSGKCGPTKKTY